MSQTPLLTTLDAAVATTQKVLRTYLWDVSSTVVGSPAADTMNKDVRCVSSYLCNLTQWIKDACGNLRATPFADLLDRKDIDGLKQHIQPVLRDFDDTQPNAKIRLLHSYLGQFGDEKSALSSETPLDKFKGDWQACVTAAEAVSTALTPLYTAMYGMGAAAKEALHLAGMPSGHAGALNEWKRTMDYATKLVGPAA
ncbi:hypothetical protein ACFVT2_38020 [Streptomyces sp. NPDC058000]|uniref:hypothetical protein n=1 Tax=Streptomyces sp. NPDC058000 TaxID=3346299 RepID=UPI0036E2CC1D